MDVSYDQSPYLSPETNAIRALIGAITESMGAQRLPGSGIFAFRKMTEPLTLTVAGTATRFDVPAGFFAQGGAGNGATSFWVINPNPCYVRLRGSSTSTHIPVTTTTGWLFPPNFFGAFSTQYPVSMSTLAVATPGIALPSTFAPLEIIYGGGA